MSGVVVPRSWAIQLVTHSTRSRPAYTLKPFSLGNFVNRLWVILVRISKGIPYYWSVPVAAKSHPGLIALRLLRSIIFITANLRPDHKSTRFVQDVLNQSITKIIKFRSTFAKGFEALGFSISSLPKSLDRKSALVILPQVCCHEEVVMLEGHGSAAHPDASSFRGSIVQFKSLGELRDALACNSSAAKQDPEPAYTAVDMGAQDSKRESISHEAEPRVTHMLPGAYVWSSATSREPSESGLPEPDEVTLGSLTVPLEEPAQVRPSGPATCHTPPPRPDTPASITDSEEDIIPLGNAALVIFGAWRRSMERIARRKRLGKFNQMGQLFEQYRSSFPKLGPKAPIRDKRALHLIRRPCINIVLGLRLLIKEIEVCEGILNKEAHVSEAAPSQVENTQDSIENRKRKVEECKNKVLMCCPLNSPPRLLLSKNITAIKTETSQAWAAVVMAKKLGIFQGSEGFKKIESLVSRGRYLVLRASRIGQRDTRVLQATVSS